jgi:hypothetical protein
MRTFPRELAAFREIVDARGAALRQSTFDALKGLESAPIEHLEVEARAATIGIIVYPRIDAARSGRAFMGEVEQAAAGIGELGLVGAKEQYLLQLRRPSVNFGHARWLEKGTEAADAAAWYAAKPGRALLVHEKTLEICFKGMQAQELGRANRQHWFLVTGGNADPACAAGGDLRRARLYIPPNASINSAP